MVWCWKKRKTAGITHLSDFPFNAADWNKGQLCEIKSSSKNRLSTSHRATLVDKWSNWNSSPWMALLRILKFYCYSDSGLGTDFHRNRKKKRLNEWNAPESRSAQNKLIKDNTAVVIHRNLLFSHWRDTGAKWMDSRLAETIRIKTKLTFCSSYNEICNVL